MSYDIVTSLDNYIVTISKKICFFSSCLQSHVILWRYSMEIWFIHFACDITVGNAAILDSVLKSLAMVANEAIPQMPRLLLLHSLLIFHCRLHSSCIFCKYPNIQTLSKYVFTIGYVRYARWWQIQSLQFMVDFAFGA